MNEPGDSSAQSSGSREIQVLILEPDQKVAIEIISALEEAVPRTCARVAHSLPETQRLVIDQKPALFVLDVDAIYEMGEDFIYDLRTSHPNARAIILTAIHFTSRAQMSGLGAIHFLEKPFPRADFIALVEALLAPTGKANSAASFHATLSDLHLADIIQLKCISGATSMLEFTGPRGEKARVYFENGQVRHATSPGKEGRAAFDEVVDWTGGKITEIPVPHGTPHTIDLDWQLLLMEAVRKIDEARGVEAEARPTPAAAQSGHKVLVIDDSVMLLNFVKEILQEEGYDVLTAENGEESLQLADAERPDLVLLDFVLPDIKGDEVSRQLFASAATAETPVVYVSGFGTDLQTNPRELPNVVGSLHKPFTSEALLATVRQHIGRKGVPGREKAETATPTISPSRPGPLPVSVRSRTESQSAARPNGVIPSNGAGHKVARPAVKMKHLPAEPIQPATATAPSPKSHTASEDKAPERVEAYFCGESTFFSLRRALQTIAREKLTGSLRAFWMRHCLELLAREGGAILVTTRDPSLYCEGVPDSLLNIRSERIEAARARQAADGCPLFVTLVGEGCILPEPGLQLVHHYGKRLFSKLWSNKVRFTFEQAPLPDYAGELPVARPDESDQWVLSTLRFVQYQELAEKAMSDPASIPAYTRDGFERVQRLQLTTAEADFASQFNGSRSIAQISRNLRLDKKVAQLTMFRFLALEIVECWPAQMTEKKQSRRGLRNLFNRQASEP